MPGDGPESYKSIKGDACLKHAKELVEIINKNIMTNYGLKIITQFNTHILKTFLSIRCNYLLDMSIELLFFSVPKQLM